MSGSALAIRPDPEPVRLRGWLQLRPGLRREQKDTQTQLVVGPREYGNIWEVGGKTRSQKIRGNMGSPV
eukprot:2028305-Pyramimonas_sp.AAC.1